MKTPTTPRPFTVTSRDPHIDSPGEWHPIPWPAMRAVPRDFAAILASTAVILAAQGRPGLYLRLVSPRGEVLAEFNPNQNPRQ